ncbi:hypothetical protein [Neisseria sp.]|uniref:hypothetical protein n=1 Tax=Neisseria sp. TaxID=192066 RepID=UPI0035A02F6E
MQQLLEEYRPDAFGKFARRRGFVTIMPAQQFTMQAALKTGGLYFYLSAAASGGKS